MSEFLNSVKSLYSRLSLDLRSQCEKFSKKISANEFEQQEVAECYKIVYQEVLALSSRAQEFSISLFSNFIDPLGNVQTKYSSVFERLLKTLDSQLNEISMTRTKFRENRELYYQMSFNSEKGQNSLNGYFVDFEAGKISRKDIERESQKQGELKKYTEESRIDYSSSIEKLNLQWHQLFSNFPQFLKTLSTVENERRAVIVSVSKVLCKILEGNLLFSEAGGKSRQKIQLGLQEAMNEATMSSPVSLHTRIEVLSKVELTVNKESAPRHDFISYESFKQLRNSTKDGFIVVEDDSDLDDLQKRKMVIISDEIFQNISNQLRLNPLPSDSELEVLFIKEQAALEFLLRGQKHLANQTFKCQFSVSKFDLMRSIVRILVTSYITRHD